MVIERLVILCSWCEDKVNHKAMVCQDDGSWKLEGYDPKGNLSHGICPTCELKVLREIADTLTQEQKHKNRPDWQRECRKCGEFDYWFRMKRGLCVYCQPCCACGKTDCEKELNGDQGAYYCLECAESTLTTPERKQRNMEALI